MATFPALTLTASGADMIAQAELGATLTFTRIAVGAGAAADPATAEDLVDEKLTDNLEALTNLGGGVVQLRATFSNDGLGTGFDLTEVGVFALDPTTSVERLHSYAKTTTPDYMPADGGTTLVEQVFTVSIAVGSSPSVTATIQRNYGVAARTVYTSGTAQTHTFQPHITSAVIEGLAGGGGGGGAGTTGYTAGGGGAAGGMFEVRVTAELTTCTYTVGGGGAGGVGTSVGAVGGDTVVVHNSVTYTAKGGGGGAAASQLAVGGAGVAGSGGDILSPGAPGGYGITGNNTTSTIGGSGGSSRCGGGASGTFGDPATTNGAAATGFGSGGGGAIRGSSGSADGGAGSGGLIIITEYF